MTIQEKGFFPAEQYPTAGDLFRGFTQHMLLNNRELILQSSLKTANKVASLALIDPKPQYRKRLGYHFVYLAINTATYQARRGIYISNLPESADSRAALPIGRMKSRHYFQIGSGPIVRENPVFKKIKDYSDQQPLDPTRDLYEPQYEFIQPQSERNSAYNDDLELNLILRDFENDLFNVQESVPVQPRTNRFHATVKIN